VYRTRDLQTEIATALAIADEVVILEVFGPGEVREPGQGGVALTAAVDLPEQAKAFVPEWDEVAAEVVRRAKAGDVVVTMGAPPISLMGDELLAALAGDGDARGAGFSRRSSDGDARGADSSQRSSDGDARGADSSQRSSDGEAPPGYTARHARPGKGNAG
jgi:UDP-N-acetylmuramate--alanine ligase